MDQVTPAYDGGKLAAFVILLVSLYGSIFDRHRPDRRPFPVMVLPTLGDQSRRALLQLSGIALCLTRVAPLFKRWGLLTCRGDSCMP